MQRCPKPLLRFKLRRLSLGASAKAFTAGARDRGAERFAFYMGDREPLVAISLTTGSSEPTALGNDHGYAMVSER